MSSQLSPLRRLAMPHCRPVGCAGVLLCALLLATGCGKKPDESSSAKATAAKAAATANTGSDNAASHAVKGNAPGTEPKGADDADDPNAKLATAYHTVRCMLAGQVRPETGLYASLGFKDAADFSSRFGAAATEDPEWARRAIERSLAKPCEAP